MNLYNQLLIKYNFIYLYYILKRITFFVILLILYVKIIWFMIYFIYSRKGVIYE
mgnify:CR=1 FL=1